MADAAPAPLEVLPETAAVHWRPRVDAGRLRRRGHAWTLTTVAHTVPFVAVAALLLALEPLSVPVAAIALAHAWLIPEIYAKRGANVLRPVVPRTPPRADAGCAETVALGLLGDLVGHAARDLHARTGLVLERGALGVWLVGERGALMVRPGGRRVDCWCVRAAADDLPGPDRTAHLLLALRADEQGFATVANLAFSGAGWRVRRRVPPRVRPALAAGAGRPRCSRTPAAPRPASTGGRSTSAEFGAHGP